MIREYLHYRYLEGAHSARAVYGTILVTAALLGFEVHETNPYGIAVRVILVGFVIVLAEVYADFVGERIRHHHELDRQAVHEIVDNAFVILSVAGFPALVFILSGLGLWSLDQAFDISYALAIVCLGLYGYLSARAAGKTTHSSIGRAALGTFIGVVIIFVKEAFGH